jgi:uncharacterized membrane protein (UPF0182 family)
VQRSNRWMMWLFGGIAAVIVVLKGLSLLADYWWFCALGQGSVFATIISTRLALGVVVGVIFFLWLFGNVRLARRKLPEGVVLIGRRLLTDEEREQVEQYLDRALLVFCLIGGLMVGLVASGHWLDWIHFRNPVEFGYKDPLFGRDASFYVFRLNMLMYVWRVFFYGFAVALVACVLVYFYEEAIRVVGNSVHALPHARTHCLLLLAGALVCKALGYRLDQFRLVFSPRGEVFYGACYADVSARLPAMWILMGLCIISAVVCTVATRGRRFLLPGGSLAVLVLFSVLGGAAYPYLIHRLVVKPNQLAKERPYIARNIEATNTAFGLNGVRDEMFELRNDLTWEDIQANRLTIDNIRLWDHRPLEQTYQITQTLRPYYQFSDVDVDRYVIGGRYRQVMLAARQLDYSRIPPPQTWVKTHLQYTHGHGICLSPVNAAGPEGLPIYWAKDIPPVSLPELKIKRPGLYYMASLHPRLIEYITSAEQGQPPPPQRPPEMDEVGEEQPRSTRRESARQRPSKGVQVDYAIVNTTEWELDYPQVAATEEGKNVLTKYSGLGGVPVGSFWRRLAFAAKFMDLQILVTGALTKDSRIIMNRYLPERFAALAPWLIYDPDPYLVVNDGRLEWICDAYTISRMFPYSRPVMGIANYIRNSVKIVCDAYDGIPYYYVFDPSDPLIRCYQKVFPTLFKPFNQMPEGIRKHLRYPQLMFMLQVEIYADYHMKDPQTFYQREDSWSVPVELYSRGRRPVEAYYVIMRLPGETKEEFLLMLPLTLRGREERVMVAWMAARCDQPNYGELIVYRLPKGTVCYGPMMVEYRISQDAEISQLMTLWSQGGSDVIRGNMLAIPVDNTILYVEPVYLIATDRATEAGGLPELRRVIVSIGDELAMGVTLDDALAKLFRKQPPKRAEGRLGEIAAREEAAAIAPSASAKTLIERALELDAEAQNLLRQGDLAGYQQKQKEQSDVLQRLREVLH